MPEVLASLDELLAGATDREAITDGAGKSGALLERLRIGGSRTSSSTWTKQTRDWTMRAAWFSMFSVLWQRGILTVAGLLRPADHAVARSAGGSSLLMRDVSAWLIPGFDDAVSMDEYFNRSTHMAQMHAHFWNSGPEIDVVPDASLRRPLPRPPGQALGLGSPPLVPQLIAKGSPTPAVVAPAAYAVVGPLSRDPGAVVEALETTPQTFVHGNFKLDNLGFTPDGDNGTIILDWEISGRGAAASDLAWYLAINCRRLPQSKEAASEAFRSALENHGVDTSSWWNRQLALSLLGARCSWLGRRHSAGMTTSSPGGRHEPSRVRSCCDRATGWAARVERRCRAGLGRRSDLREPGRSTRRCLPGFGCWIYGSGSRSRYVCRRSRRTEPRSRRGHRDRPRRVDAASRWSHGSCSGRGREHAAFCGRLVRAGHRGLLPQSPARSGGGLGGGSPRHTRCRSKRLPSWLDPSRQDRGRRHSKRARLRRAVLVPALQG